MGILILNLTSLDFTIGNDGCLLSATAVNGNAK
jgi:hypothetical protein